MVKTIIIDPGHGGRDPGSIGNDLVEKEITLELSLQTKKYLDTYFTGHKTYLTRSKDVFIELEDRAAKANILQADCFISIHVNASASTSGRGFETYIYDKTQSLKTRELQNRIHENIMKYAPIFNDRGKKLKNLSVLRNTNMPAVLTENGFLSNKADSEDLKSDTNIKNLAKGHAIGIAEFLGLQKKEAVTQKTIYKVAKTFDELSEAKAFLSSIEKDYRGFTIYTEKS